MLLLVIIIANLQVGTLTQNIESETRRTEDAEQQK